MYTQRCRASSFLFCRSLASSYSLSNVWGVDGLLLLLLFFFFPPILWEEEEEEERVMGLRWAMAWEGWVGEEEEEEVGCM